MTDGVDGEIGVIDRLQDGSPNLRYELNQGTGIAVEPGTRFQVRGVAHARLLIVSLVPR